ncbi:MAG: NuoM family protein [Leptolyngbya sp.]|nr:NuoM family protein [Candidatus Melainabacteria bacterium]
MEQPQSIITALLLTPFIGSVAIALLPADKARNLAIFFSLVMCILSGVAVSAFKVGTAGYQFEQIASWITTPFPIQYHVGVDGLSLGLAVLTSFVTLMAVLASTSIGDNRPKLFYSFVMMLTLSIMGVFVSLDLLQFFIMYELELVPMYFLIAIWGGPRRDYAAMKFLLYTFFGGVLMLAGLIYLYFALTVDNPLLATFDMVKLASAAPLLPKSAQLLAFLGFFFAFIIKLPSFPFHTWLPDAHVEAPTPISMILAGLLLKMGSYGLIRICMDFFPTVFIDYGYLIMTLGAFNIVWAAIACLVQKDMKRIIAFSSVSHMGFILLGLGSLSAAAVNGAVFQMISHGVISAMLFFLVGAVYERTHTRDLDEIGGGLAKDMPYLFYLWMFATMANLGLPGLSGFVGEVAVFYGAYTSPLAATIAPHHEMVQTAIVIAATGVVLTAGYMLWLLKRLFYGDMLPKWAGHLSDARPTEKLVGWGLALSILFLGIYPAALINWYGSVTDNITNNVTSKMFISESSNSTH